jgi:hypothetical protein
MKYIAKAKGASRFKTFESISEFSIDEFDKYELYEVNSVDQNRYGQILKHQKIEELKMELQSLGVDFNSLATPQTPQTTQVPHHIPHGEITNESPLLMEDGINSKPLPAVTDLSKIKNPETGKLFTMDEMRVIHEKTFQECYRMAYHLSKFLVDI